VIGHGYDPGRILTLRETTRAAVGNLDAALGGEVRHDPDAADARRVVGLLLANLTGQWVPLLDRIVASDAMTTWRASGPQGDDLAAVVRRLVGGTGPARWQPLSRHFDRSTAEVARGLLAAAAAYREIVDRGGDLRTARADLLAWLGEAADRAVSPTAATILRRTLGEEGIASVLRAAEQDTELEQLGLLSTTEASGGVRPGVLGATALRLLDGLVGDDPTSRTSVVERITASAALLSLLTASAHRLGDELLGALTRATVLGTAGQPLWSGTPGVVDRTAAAEALVRALADRPELARSLLADPEVAAILATADTLDATTAESLWAAALGRPGDDPDDLTARLEVLATLSRLAPLEELSAGTRRGVARGIAPLWPTLSPHLDRRFDVWGSWRDGTILEIGPYEDVATLMGQVVDDPTAQRSLGVGIRAFLHDQLATAAVDVRRAPDETPADAALHVAARLADVSRVVDLVVDGAAEREELLQFRHGIAVDGANLLVAVGTLGLGWVLTPTAPISARVAALTSRGVQHALGQAAPREVDDGDVHEAVARQVVAEVLTLPVGDPGLRSPLGLEGVPAEVWEELDGLLAAVGAVGATGTAASVADVRGDPAHVRLQRLVETTPALDRYVETVLGVGRDADRD
jgi:hypothetical protein